MKCPHCLVEIHSNSTINGTVMQQGHMGFQVEFQDCPSCKKLIIELANGPIVDMNGYGWINKQRSTSRFVYPMASSRPVPAEVPINLASDYLEAATVLVNSPKASAALSRRILQAIIHDHAGIKKRNLFEEIQALIDAKTVPTHITDELDLIRHIGNWAAHPNRYETTGEIVDVEPNEAEACLDAIDGLFDFYFVQPAKSLQRRQAIQQKIDAQKKTS